MHVEDDLAAMFSRLAPGYTQHLRGASVDQIDEYEGYVTGPLPDFYRWFLCTMGCDMGPLTGPRLDMRIETLLSVYQSGYRPPHSLMLVGVDPSEVMPTYVYCDLSRRTRGDALVCSSHPAGGQLQDESETLRESIASSVFGRSLIRDRPQCAGKFVHTSRKVLEQLEPILMHLGFETLHRSGPLCGLYARDDVALKCGVPPAAEARPYMFFTCGGDELSIRSTLGMIGTATSIEVDVNRWTRPNPP